MPISIEGPLGCHIWRGALTPRGYPVMKFQGKTRLARRVFFEQGRRPLLPGERIEMECGERACVLASHMKVVTSK
jgi:hypothetical protein